MSTANDLLDRLAEIGAEVEAAGTRLLVRAGPKPIPGELVQGLRDAKAEVLAILAPLELNPDPGDRSHAGEEAAWWRREFTIRTLDWLLENRTQGEAEQHAFDRLVAEWHRLCGERIPECRCVGCGELIGGLPSLDFRDGNRVHLDKLACLFGYGQRWRGAARQALIAMGLCPPSGEDAR